MIFDMRALEQDARKARIYPGIENALMHPATKAVIENSGWLVTANPLEICKVDGGMLPRFPQTFVGIPLITDPHIPEGEIRMVDGEGIPLRVIHLREAA